MATKKQETKQSPGGGKKFCPQCGEIIAARSMKHECGWVGTPKEPKEPKAAKDSGETKEIKLLKILKARGFDVKGSRDIFDAKAEVKIETEKALTPLLEYVPNYTANGKFELSLDQLLTLLKLPLNK